MDEKRTLDVTEIDIEKQEWICPACGLAVPFRLFVCPRCGYDAQPFLQRMMANRLPTATRSKRKIGAGFVFGMAIWLGWLVSALVVIATFGTVAMLLPSLVFGIFTLILIAWDSWRSRKKRKRRRTAEELAGVATGLMALAEELTRSKKK